MLLPQPTDGGGVPHVPNAAVYCGVQVELLSQRNTYLRAGAFQWLIPGVTSVAPSTLPWEHPLPVPTQDLLPPGFWCHSIPSNAPKLFLAHS
jgi:hypothetical protein